MTTHKYLWTSYAEHPERFGQLCTVTLAPHIKGRVSNEITVTFDDGTTVAALRKHVRLDSPANRAKYLRAPLGEMRTCSKCGRTLDLSEFQVATKKGRNGRREECRECASRYLREYSAGKRYNAPSVEGGL